MLEIKSGMELKVSHLEVCKKNNMVGTIYPDWGIIEELRKEYNVITIFLSAKKEIITERLLKRNDPPKDKKKSIEYVPTFIKEYKKINIGLIIILKIILR